MSDNGPRQPSGRVSGPLVRGKLMFEPVVPTGEPVVDGPLIHVGHRLIRGQVLLEPVEPVVLELTLTPAPGADAGELAAKVGRLIDSLDEFEKALGGAGVTRDPGPAANGPGTVTLVLRPNDPAGAEFRLGALAKVADAAVAFGTGVRIRTEVKPAA